MQSIIHFNPAIGTLNLGDVIIAQSIKAELRALLGEAFVVDLSTHLPVPKSMVALLEKCTLRFALGTNLLRDDLDGMWAINENYAQCILVGCGWNQKKSVVSNDAADMYRSVLSKQIMHSVRDSYTEDMLRNIGIENVLNTACPTMWTLSKEFCRTIPSEKAESVIFTVTDYRQMPEFDRRILNTLLRRYQKVYVWIQGFNDYGYLKRMDALGRVSLIAPTLDAYDHILRTQDVEYIGTRLHGGIRALQRGRRSLILAVDNRAVNISRDTNLPILKREHLDALDDFISSSRETKIILPEKNITKWKAQFHLLQREAFSC